MSATSAQIQILNRCAISSPIQQRTHSEKLVEREFTVKNMAAREPVGIFQILRGDDLVRQNQLGKSRSILRQGFNHGVAQRNSLAKLIDDRSLRSARSAESVRGLLLA